MAVLVVFSIFCQQSAGLSFGIVPFVSKRSTGLVSGFVGSGGNVGGAVTQVGTSHRWWLLLLLLLLLYSIGPSIIVRGPVALALLFDRHAAWAPTGSPEDAALGR
jgi:nitrate/nitrite transporter NarK